MLEENYIIASLYVKSLYSTFLIDEAFEKIVINNNFAFVTIDLAEY